MNVRTSGMFLTRRIEALTFTACVNVARELMLYTKRNPYKINLINIKNITSS